MKLDSLAAGSRLRPHIKRILLVVFFIVPITAATVYMLTLWDPAPKMRDIPLAVVNEDQGATIQGKPANLGADTTKNLVNTDYLDFHEVKADQAARGLERTEYLFTVHIPKDYSASIASMTTDHPHHAEITLTYNDYNGTAGAVLTNGLAPELKSKINTALAESYAKAILQGMQQLRGGLGKASSGAGMLNQGATQLADGAHQLKDGSGQLRDGLGRLTSGGHQLQSGTDQLADGMSRVDAGVHQLNDKLIPMLQKAQGFAPQLEAASQTLRAIGQTERANSLHELAVTLGDNQDGIVSKLNQLNDGTRQLLYNLADPNSPYRGGVERLANGLDQANNGSIRLDDGLAQLLDGANRLKDGSGELHKGLADGFAKAPAFRALEASAAQIAHAVDFKEVNLHPAKSRAVPDDPSSKVPDSGASLLIILVFGFFMMFAAAVLLPDLPRGKVSAGKVRNQFLMLLAINLMLVSTVTMLATSLAWKPSQWPVMLTVLGITALSNTSILVVIKTLFDKLTAVGVALGLFALGMFSFGGIWPISTVPALFKAIRPLHWMTYQRNAFIQATSGNLDSLFTVLSLIHI